MTFAEAMQKTACKANLTPHATASTISGIEDMFYSAGSSTQGHDTKTVWPYVTVAPNPIPIPTAPR